MMAVVVNPGAFRSCRSASRKSATIRPSRSVRPELHYENSWLPVPVALEIMD
jgi:hypothetical protein